MKKNLKSQVAKKQESEILKVYDIWMKSYLNGDIDTYGHYLDKDYHFVGSTAFEEFLNKADTSSFFEKTADQLSGKTDLRNNRYILEKFGDIVFLTHFCDAWFLNGTEWSYYSRFRCTNALHETKDGWRFIYQHYSTPDEKAEEGQTIGYQKISEENLQLREAIKRRTTELEEKNRELEIESALERVRSEALAMDKSSDLLDIVVTMRKEFTDLGHDAHYFWHMMWLPDTYEKAMTSGDGTKIGMVMELPRHIHGKIPLLNKWEKSNEPTVVYPMDAEEAIDYVHKMIELGDFQQVDPHAPSDDDIRSINGLTFIMARTTHGEIGYSLPGVVKDPPQESLELLKRFARAFDFAHKRFQDLKRKEKQAREIEIELALEKVRSRSMAMHKSEELADLSMELVKQVQALGVKTWFCAFNIYNDDGKGSLEWGSNGEGTFPKYQTPREGVFLKYFKAGQRGDKLFINEIDKKECPAHYEYLCTLPGVGDQLLKMKKEGIPFPESQIDHVAFFKHGYVLFITYEPVPESHEIFKRFAKVFEQTYTRFLDLKKAEEQAREAQIEAALEKVRSRALAMHKSDELNEVVSVLFEKLKELHISFTAAGIATRIEGSKDLNGFVCGENPDGLVITNYRIPHFKNPIANDLYSALEKQLDLFVRHYSKEEKDSFYEYMIEHTAEIRHLPEDIKRMIFESTTYTISMVAVNNAVFNINDFEGKVLTEEEAEIIKRFARVFDQAYTRFLDLQKAEKQAREAQIEAALERVRARSMAMHRSQDMEGTVITLFDEVSKLGLDKSIRCGIGILDENTDYMETYSATSNPEGAVDLRMGMLNMNVHPMLVEIKQSWKLGKPSFQYYFDRENLLNYYKILNDDPDYHFERNLDALPEEEFQRGFFFKEGILFAFASNPFSEESINILNRFAAVFGQTYTRFLDLQKAEKQAREAQINLAVERVRAKALAMYKSEEILQVVNNLKNELIGLEIPTVTAATIHLKESDGKYRIWDLTSLEDTEKGLDISLDITYRMEDTHPDFFIREVWERKEDYFVVIQGGGRIQHTVQWLRDNGHAQEAQDFLDFQKETNLEAAYHPTVPLQSGRMSIDVLEEPSPEVESILKKMAQAFDLAYKRFLDLQRAEAQAREAQIESALEKVRSRSLAMNATDELGEVISVVVEKLRELDFYVDDGVALVTSIEGSKDLHEWMVNPDFLSAMKFHLPYFNHPVLSDYWKAKEAGLDFVANRYSAEESQKFHEHIFEHSDFRDTPQEVKEYCLNANTYAAFIAFQKNTAIFINDYSGKTLSDQQIAILKRFARVFEQAYVRFMDLQKAEAQAREAQIEMSLEKVRSRTMAMQKGDELKDVVVLLYKELLSLGVTDFTSCGYVEINEKTGRQHTYITSPGGDSLGLFYLPLEGDPVFDERYAAWKRQQTVFHQTVGGQDRKDHLAYAITTFNSEEAEEMVLTEFPDPTVFYCFNFSHGYLHIVGGSILKKEEEDLMARFTRVFEQTYARFLDLQKAEIQTREAQIEMALEKVRSRTMAMQNSNELNETAQVMFSEIKNLGIPTWSCGYNIFRGDHSSCDCWMSSGGILLDPFTIEFKNEPSFMEQYEFFESEETFMVQEESGEVLKSHYDYMRTIPSLGSSFKSLDEAGIPLPEYQINHLCKFTGGYLLFITYEKVPEAHDIFKRFTKVFEQTYTRFQDLQNAEAQARESRIEAALERVRSKSMGMQASEDFGNVTTEMFDQLRHFGEDLFALGIVFCDKHDGYVEQWHSLPKGGMLSPFIVPVDLDYIHQYRYDQWKKGTELFSIEIPEDFIQQHFKDIFDLPSAQVVLEDFESRNTPMPGPPPWEIDYGASFKNGYILASSLKPLENMDILPRFAKVFEQAYTRFLDLQKAEEREKEAIKQASLDRVRGEIASMRTAKDLERITPLIWKELTALGVPFFRCGVFIIREDEKMVHTYLSKPDGTSVAAIHIPFKDTENQLIEPIIENWRSQHTFKEEWDREKFIEQTSIFMNKGQVENPETYRNLDMPPENLVLHLVPFKQGMLYVGNHEDLTQDQISLVESLSKAFSVAYSRYEDFKALETTKNSLELTINDLKSTQAQLIQAEKMASLGELTAGIAHEIQNPLNFVNNFSEVSEELVDEMKEELAKGDLEEAVAISNDLKNNLSKINHHGKRADAIVKGMLEHSRLNKGEKKPTDINELADEFVRLSYHGLRAKDKSFNADFKLELDPGLPKVNVVSSDIGRVILNLVNNAFYAVDEKNKSGVEKYRPEVIVSSKRTSSGILLSVKDNGDGLPESIAKKIFQPFFTTKPTGKGTGLGLSLSYDIIKAHGGDLKIANSAENGVGAEFIMEIPCSL